MSFFSPRSDILQIRLRDKKKKGKKKRNKEREREREKKKEVAKKRLVFAILGPAFPGTEGRLPSLSLHQDVTFKI